MMRIKFSFFICLFLTVWMGGCATVQQDSFISSVENTYLKDLCRKHNVQWQWDGVSQVVTLRQGHQTASALVGSNVVLFNGQKIMLSHPLKTKLSAVVVPSDFKRKVLDLFDSQDISQSDYRVKKMRRIILDAGHGGKDPGAKGFSGLLEKKVVLDIALRLKQMLKKKGIKVIMTRKKDKFLSLQQRAEIASNKKSDLFVSIHANSSPAKGAQGIEIFTLKDLDRKEKNEEKRMRNQNLYLKNLTMKKNDKKLKNIVGDMLYDHKQVESIELADDILFKTSQYLFARNRGQKESRFYVLRNTMIPAVLVEVGFLTNPKEERLLKTARYRHKVASGIANSIVEYMRQ